MGTSLEILISLVILWGILSFVVLPTIITMFNKHYEFLEYDREFSEAIGLTFFTQIVLIGLYLLYFLLLPYLGRNLGALLYIVFGGQ